MRFEEYTDLAGVHLAEFRLRKEYEPDPACLPCLLFALQKSLLVGRRELPAPELPGPVVDLMKRWWRCMQMS